MVKLHMKFGMGSHQISHIFEPFDVHHMIFDHLRPEVDWIIK
jgi:hypothetical protein